MKNYVIVSSSNNYIVVTKDSETTIISFTNEIEKATKFGMNEALEMKFKLGFTYGFKDLIVVGYEEYANSNVVPSNDEKEKMSDCNYNTLSTTKTTESIGSLINQFTLLSQSVDTVASSMNSLIAEFKKCVSQAVHVAEQVQNMVNQNNKNIDSELEKIMVTYEQLNKLFS